MTLSLEQILELNETAKSAALQAGKVISGYPREKLEVNKKSGGDSLASQVVTEVDLLAEKKIIEVLTPTLSEYDLALLSEESVDDKSRLEKDYFWCIDPIDGTLPFIEGTSGYAVAISLVAKDGTPIIGVINDAFNGILYNSVKSQGATRNGEKFLVSKELTDRPFTFVSDRSIKNYFRHDEVMEKLGKLSTYLGYNGFETILHGGAAMNSCWLIENAPAAYFKFPKPQQGGGSLWDFAASSAVVLEAGGFAKDFYGDPLDLNRPDSTYMNHKGALLASDQKIAEEIMKIFEI